MSHSHISQNPGERRRRDRLHVSTQWAWHFQTLVALRDHLLQQLRSPQTMDDFDRNFIQSLLAHEPDALGEINAALERILHGRYGICERTGRPISATCLRARPWARYAADTNS